MRHLKQKPQQENTKKYWSHTKAFSFVWAVRQLEQVTPKTYSFIWAVRQLEQVTHENVVLYEL